MIWAVLATGVTLCGLAASAQADPKRARTFGRPPPPAPTRWRWARRAAIFGPGGALALASAWPDFLIWMGAGLTLGWALAALRPGAAGAATERAVKSLRARLRI